MIGRMLVAGVLVPLWLVAGTTGGAAAECFCAFHARTGSVLRGCTEWRGPQDDVSTAVCRDPETREKTEQRLTSEWTRLRDGEDRCTPCRRASVGTTDEVPRGPEGEGIAAPARAAPPPGGRTP